MIDEASHGNGAGPRLSRRRASTATSGWAIAAMVCAVGFACPLLPLLAVVLGWRALHHVTVVPGRRGRGLAIGAVVLGAVGVVLWAGAAYWWNRHARQPMLDGPAAALAAGFSGDTAAFVAGLGATDRDEAAAEAEAFLLELTGRYGAYEGIGQREGGRASGPVLRDGRAVIPYQMRFADEVVDARARFVVAVPGDPGLVLRFDAVEVLDPSLGNLAFPPGAFAEDP